MKMKSTSSIAIGILFIMSVAGMGCKKKDLQRIVTYCEKDTVAVAQILLRFNNQKIITDKEIVSID